MNMNFGSFRRFTYAFLFGVVFGYMTTVFVFVVIMSCFYGQGLQMSGNIYLLHVQFVCLMMAPWQQRITEGYCIIYAHVSNLCESVKICRIFYAGFCKDRLSISLKLSRSDCWTLRGSFAILTSFRPIKFDMWQPSGLVDVLMKSCFCNISATYFVGVFLVIAVNLEYVIVIVWLCKDL